jgi:gamma-glutamyl:cysteine ligase YbdK (ATP-grasp superfamily)
MSTCADRLAAIHDAYSKAYARRLADWAQAQADDQAQAISDNLEELELNYLRAAKQALDADGSAVENAYAAAKQAQTDVDDAYQAAKGIAEKIQLVSSVVTSVGDLLQKASGSA